ncbi:MAG TPA: alpha/beta fold hydrolase [Ktedonobacteraceae bacterium]|nr:alpha/beta fold hydrolase [Ktedonobacteraceae bacterium]
MRYRVMGSGEPVILVHGLSGSILWWTRNIASLAQHYAVYLVDLPGFGTLARRQHFALTGAADWLLEWLQAVGLTRANWIGHSMGGYICIQIAARRPEVVKRLVLVAPAALPVGHRWQNYLLPLVEATRYMQPSFLPILFYDAVRAGPLTLLRATKDLLAKDVREDARSIQAPTLLIWGANDTLVPAALGDILRKEIAGSRLLILKRAGHVVMYDRSQAFNEAVLAFLTEPFDQQRRPPGV